MTRVSIITPYLDAEAHLRAAIESVQAQTVGDWELLLVNDGSTDGSPQIAAAAARADPRIRLLERPTAMPGGAAAARNLGIAGADGDFVAFLDADDLFEPVMLVTALEAADRYPEAAIVFGPTRWWYPGEAGRDWLEPTYGREGRLHSPPSLLRELILLQRGQVPCTCSVLIRRAVAAAVGGFEVSLRLYEDQTLWVKLFLEYDVYVTAVPLSRYRQHPRSVSAQAAAAGEYDRLRAHSARGDFLVWVDDYLRATGAAEPRLARALRLARAPYRRDGAPRLRRDRLVLAFERWRWRRRCWMRRQTDRLGRLRRLVHFGSAH